MSELANLVVQISSKLDSTGLDNTIKKLETVEKSMENVTAGFKIMGLALVGFATGGVLAMKSLVDSIADSEKKVALLNNALKTAGFDVNTVSKAYQGYASGLQAVTKYSDEAIMSVETFLTQMSVGPSVMEKSLTAVTNLASALDIDLQSATMLVGKAAEGNTTMMGRYGIKLDEVKLKAGGFSYVLGEINRKFGGSAITEANSYTGKIEKLKNSFDDLKESLGVYVLPTFTAFVKTLTDFVDGLNKISAPNKGFIVDMGMPARS